jgi:hypothetical protein
MLRWHLVAIRSRVAVAATLLFCSLPRQGLLYPSLLSRLKVIRVPLHFLDDVLCQNLAFEPAQRIIQRLAFLQSNLCQTVPPLCISAKSHAVRAYITFRLRRISARLLTSWYLGFKPTIQETMRPAINVFCGLVCQFSRSHSVDFQRFSSVVNALSLRDRDG